MKLIKVFSRSPAVVVTSVLVFLFSLFAFSAEAQVRFTYSSGIIAASAVVSKYPCLLTDVAVYANGSAGATVILYDNATTAAGTVIGKVILPTTSTSGGLVISTPVKASNGVYVSITGTGASAIVFTTPQ